MAKFSDVSDDILNLVLEQLRLDSPKALLQFSLVSKGCRKLAKRLLYHTIVLSGLTERISHSQQILKTLLDLNVKNSEYVRELRIQDWAKNDALPSASIQLLLEKLTQLHLFSWESKTWIPEDIISTLEKHWPDAKLCIKLSDRGSPYEEESNLDMRLLSSPLLYSLDLPVFCSRPVQGGKVHSELPRLKQVITQAPRLRRMAIYLLDSLGTRQFIPGGPSHEDQIHVPRNSEDLHKAQLPLRANDWLPPLTEVRLSSVFTLEYDLSIEHCTRWAQCADLTKLHTLDLGNLSVEHLLRQWTGKVPNLKILSFGIWPNNGVIDLAPAKLGQPEGVVAFVEGIDSLRELSILAEGRRVTGSGSSDIPVPFVSILAHAKSLAVLRYRSPYHHSRWLQRALTEQQLEQLTSFWKLEQLDTYLYLSPSRREEGSLSQIGALTQLHRLRTLKVTVDIPLTQSQAGDSTESQENRKAMKVAEELFVQIYNLNRSARLEHLEVSFLMQNRGSAWSPIKRVEVRRKERDDAPKPWETGGYDVRIVL